MPGMFTACSRGLSGMLAMIFPRKSLERIVDHRIAARWRGVRGNRKPENVEDDDIAVGTIMDVLDLELWMFHPSPVRHIGRTSSVHHAGNWGKRNCERCADHKQALYPQIFP